MAYVGHMLDKAHDALSLARGKTRHDYDNDLALRLALTHLKSGTRTFRGMPSQVCRTRSCPTI